MKIILTSTNLAKKKAVELILRKFFSKFSLETLKVSSSVSNTPTSDKEGIKGCLNRINYAKKIKPGADLYIGLEGVMNRRSFGTFVYGWCMVESNKMQRRSLACSAKVQIPEYIAKKVNSQSELSDVMKKEYNSDLVKQIDTLGTNGILTNKAYTRVDEFEDAIHCALAFLYNDSNYSEIV